MTTEDRLNFNYFHFISSEKDLEKKNLSRVENTYLELRCCLTSPISQVINGLTIRQKRVRSSAQWASKHL